MKRNSRKRLTGLLCVALALTMATGALAWFTDRVEANASVSVMDKGVVIDPDPNPDTIPDETPDDPSDDPDPNIPDPGDFEEDPTSPDDPSDDLTDWWTFLNAEAKKNFNPGDHMVLGYKMKNAGNLDFVTRETFWITSSEPLTADSEEFKLCTAVTIDENGAATAAGAPMTFTPVEVDGKVGYYCYKVVLTSDTPVPANVTNNFVNKDYYVVFSKAASNDFQEAICRVDYVVEAMQAGGDWDVAASGHVTVGGTEYEHFVPPYVTQ